MKMADWQPFCFSKTHVFQHHSLTVHHSQLHLLNQIHAKFVARVKLGLGIGKGDRAVD